MHDLHVCNYLLATAHRVEPAGPLFLCQGIATSACQARQRVAALAAALSQRLLLQPGDRVCLAAQTTAAHLEALLAVTAAGCIAAPLNSRWPPDEAARAAALVGASALVADAACAALACGVAAACPSIVTLVLLGPRSDYVAGDLAAAAEGGARVDFAEELLAGEPAPSWPRLAPRPAPASGVFVPKMAPEGAALLVFTSGTTGAPRAALLTHAAMHAQCVTKLRQCGYGGADVYLHASPLFHVGGLCSALAVLLAGARHVFLPAFSAPAALEAISRHDVTSFIAVPTMVADLVSSAAREGPGAAYPSVRMVLVGAGALRPELQTAVCRLFPRCTLLSAYGMTEACSSLTLCTLRQPNGGGTGDRAQSGSSGLPASSRNGDGGSDGAYVGRPPPGIELGVCAPEAPLAGSAPVRGEGRGEVVSRGPHLMLRYWADEAATAAAFLPGGWFRTGDLGGLWLLGRAKDVVKSGGENVAAWEVERCLSSHPGVDAAAVVGVPERRLGEAVAAVVVLKQGWGWSGPPCQCLLPAIGLASGAREAALGPAAAPAAMTTEEGASGKMIDAAALQGYCRQRGLAGFKLPRVVAVAAGLPRNATGKVAKAQLTRDLEAQLRTLLQSSVGATPPPRSRL